MQVNEVEEKMNGVKERIYSIDCGILLQLVFLCGS